MKEEKYFIIVSIIAFVSLSYIAFNNFVVYGPQFAAVATTNTKATTTAATTTTRGLPPESPVNYTDNKNGTITDNYTGLIWKKCSQGVSGNDCKYGSPSLREWAKARVECENLNFAGKKGWRIPTLKELQSIVDTGTFDPAINKKFFVGSSYPYWTLTSPAEYPVSKFTVVFSDGVTYYKDAGNFAATRCVYDGVILK